MHLTLFFTRGMSLKAWDEIGMFDREVALYERLCEMGVSISFVTYGNSDDLEFQERLPGIEILCNRWDFPIRVYEKFLHRFHGKALRDCDLIKTNQTKGAEIALRSAKFWNKPLIARMGYMMSELVAYDYGNNSLASKRAYDLESKVFSKAQRIVVTTQTMARDIADRIPEVERSTVIIPNYVDTNMFYPDSNISKDFDLVFVGRITPDKNISSLLEAIRDIDATLLIIGNGHLKNELQVCYESINERLKWIDQVPNAKLPTYLNRAGIYVLPSLSEGHPKTLIEAMACGLTVLGSDIPPIKEIINHGKNGFYCGTDPEIIRSVIEKLLVKPGLCKSLGENARKYAVENFSLDRILEIEYELYLKILSERKTETLN